jgi:hypothetical protein
MFDLSQPVPNEVVIGSIIFIFILVGVGLLIIEWFKRGIK